MAKLKVHVIPKGKTYLVDFRPDIDTEQAIIDRLKEANIINDPPPALDGGVTIWRMKKKIKSNKILLNCIEGTGFYGVDTAGDDEVAFLSLVRDPIPDPD